MRRRSAAPGRTPVRHSVRLIMVVAVAPLIFELSHYLGRRVQDVQWRLDAFGTLGSAIAASNATCAASDVGAVTT